MEWFMRFQDSLARRSATGILGRIAGGASGAQVPDAAAGDRRKAEDGSPRARDAVSRSLRSPPPPHGSRLRRAGWLRPEACT